MPVSVNSPMSAGMPYRSSKASRQAATWHPGDDQRPVDVEQGDDALRHADLSVVTG
jgi:hypothetical protein